MAISNAIKDRQFKSFEEDQGDKETNRRVSIKKDAYGHLLTQLKTIELLSLDPADNYLVDNDGFYIILTNGGLIKGD